MKNKDILKLLQGLNQISNYPGTKFAYCVAKNMNIIKPELESLNKAVEQTKEFKEYENKRIELAIKYAKKDSKGDPTIANNEYVLEDKKGFDKQIKELQKGYDKAIKEREKQFEEYNKLLEEDVDIKLYQIELDNLPKEITPQQMSAILSIVKEVK